MKPNPENIARTFGCTVEQAKAGLARNAEGFREMAEKAEKSGKKYRGYTATELRESERLYREASL